MGMLVYMHRVRWSKLTAKFSVELVGILVHFLFMRCESEMFTDAFSRNLMHANRRCKWQFGHLIKYLFLESN